MKRTMCFQEIERRSDMAAKVQRIINTFATAKSQIISFYSANHGRSLKSIDIGSITKVSRLKISTCLIVVAAVKVQTATGCTRKV